MSSNPRTGARPPRAGVPPAGGRGHGSADLGGQGGQNRPPPPGAEEGGPDASTPAWQLESRERREEITKQRDASLKKGQTQGGYQQTVSRYNQFVYNQRVAQGEASEGAPRAALVTLHGAHMFLRSLGGEATWAMLDKAIKPLQWKLKVYHQMKGGEAPKLRSYGPIATMLATARKQKVVRQQARYEDRQGQIDLHVTKAQRHAINEHQLWRCSTGEATKPQPLPWDSARQNTEPNPGTEGAQGDRDTDATTGGEGGDTSSSSGDSDTESGLEDAPLRQQQQQQQQAPQQAQQQEQEAAGARKRKRTSKPRGKTKLVIPYAMRFDLLAQFASLGRGHESRERKLADCLAYRLEHVENHAKAAVVAAAVTRLGKTNKNGHARYLGFMRHVEPQLCPTGALALLLFMRFEVTKEAPPSFERRKDWYNIPVSVTGKRSRKTGLPKPISYTTQRRHFKASLVHAGVSQHRKVTHIGRASGAKNMMAMGLSREAVMGFGQWLRSVADNDYITELDPRCLMRQAGVSRADTAAMRYTLPRGMLDPPPELVHKVFTWVDNHRPCVIARNAGNGPEAGKDLAAEGFLNLMVHLRHVLLQDCVFLQASHPYLSIFGHALFHGPRWEAWCEQLRGFVEKQEAEESTTTALPEAVAEAMGNLRRQVREATRQSEQRDKEILDGVRALLERHEGGQGGGGGGGGGGAGMGPVLGIIGAAVTHLMDPPEVLAQRVLEAARAGQAAPMAGGQPGNAPRQQDDEGVGDHRTGDGAPHILIKGVKTVMEVWNEFHVGSPGRTPLCKLIADHGMEWRDERYVSKQVFSERMTLLGAVVHLGQHRNVSNTDAALWLQAYQEHKQWHVNKVRKEMGILRAQGKKEGRGWGALVYEVVGIPTVLSKLRTTMGGRTRDDVNDVTVCFEARSVKDVDG